MSARRTRAILDQSRGHGQYTVSAADLRRAPKRAREVGLSPPSIGQRRATPARPPHLARFVLRVAEYAGHTRHSHRWIWERGSAFERPFPHACESRWDRQRARRYSLRLDRETLRPRTGCLHKDHAWG